ncbi:unnamed protein product [Ambrosiozyma monospora]|uniref:Unnamed protein product n=1 Tax=Ambrosiozyma monospora TaxID=43982 RepID=A0A9W7DFZ8_AMBMO|nr:unnamed protein product [Ambrosiozyma monospora]
MMGRKAYYIYLTLTSTTIPSIINLRQIIQEAVNQEFEGFTWFFFLLLYDIDSWTSAHIKDKVLSGMDESSPQTASLIESWLVLTSRSGSHPNTPAQPTAFSITSLPPESALKSNIQHSFTSSPLQDTSFNSTSKIFYESNWKDYLLIPSRATDKNITGWKQFWSIFSKYVNKNPGSYSAFHLFQTGHLFHQFNLNSKETCCLCKQSDFKGTNDHILDKCIITNAEFGN